MYNQVRVQVGIGKETFKMKGQSMIKKGFLEVVPKSEISEKIIPEFRVGDILEVSSKRIAEAKVRLVFKVRLLHLAT